MLAAWLAGAGDLLSLESLFARRAWLRGLVAERPAVAVAAFVAVYIFVVSLSIPGAFVLSVTGGFLFGALFGGALSVLCATTGATIFFAAARGPLGDALAARAGPKLARIQAGFRDGAASWMLFLRFVTLFPFVLVNLAAASFGIPIATFVWTTLIGIAPGTFAFATAGAGLDQALTAQAAAFDLCLASGRVDCRLGIGAKALLTPHLLIAFAALGALSLAPLALRRWRGAGTAP
jgi:uncharacterized membrane protein YdjX (TVP38/TMEM64 family)